MSTDNSEKKGKYGLPSFSSFPSIFSNKRGNIFIIGAIVLLALGVSGYFGIGSLLGYDIVYKQNWGHICCEQENDYDYFVRYADDKPEFTCDQYTNECVVSVYPAEKLGLAGRSLYIQIDGGAKDLLTWNAYSPPSEVKTFTLKYGQSIKFSQSFWPNGNDWKYIQYQVKWKNFYIKGQENGRVYRQESCILNSDLKKRVLSDGLNELAKSGANNCQNYLVDFVQVATKTYSYNNREVICQARQLYSVEQEQFKDGQTRKLQGDFVASVECCPHESNCDENTFKFVEFNERECSYSSECANGGNPVADSGTSYIKYSCVNGQCVKSNPQWVECTNNAVCIQKFGENSVCDLSPSNWGTCKDNSAFVGYCGDGLCESIIGETETSCPEDCGDYKSPWSIPWWWWVIGTALLIFLWKPIIRPLLKMIPYVGRFVP